MMLLLHCLPIFLALSSSTLALPAIGSHARKNANLNMTVIERLAEPPNGWIRDESFEIDKNAAAVKLRIHLVQQGMEKFHDVAMKIATPGHDLYGSHLSQKVIDSMIAPKDESSNLVMQWIESENLGSQAAMSARFDFVIVEASIAQVEKLLRAKYEIFSFGITYTLLVLRPQTTLSYNQVVQPETGSRVLRTLEYSLPDILKGHVDMVQPTTFFGLRAMRSTISEVRPITASTMHVDVVEAVSGCSGSTVTPKCLSNLYNFASSTSSQSAGQLGIAGFLEQWPSQSDLSTFMDSYAIQGNTAETYSCTLVNGGTCPSTENPGTEANLDVQYARAITKEIPNVFYSVGGSPPIVGGGSNTNEPYLEFLDYLLALNESALPNTVSISYGDDESTVPLDYADTVCNLFAQLGARGVSVLVASGDSGVGDTCTSGSTKTFTTSFPASCPWVTVVGGTTGNSPEKAWSGSGGGFSSVFGRASYQNTAVTNWLTNDKTHTGVSKYFNSSGRAYPDVAAQATNFVIVASGSTEGVDGTSCATPTFASLVQLLNSDRIASGKKGLGFLNPWLYANATSALTDIKSGKNTGCSGVISGAGFSAVAGWDPATGLGTPNYASLLVISRST